VAIGEAYVETARAHPAHFQVMFRTDIVDQEAPNVMECGLRAYGALQETVERLIATEALAVDRDAATWLCWSAMQGLVVIEPKIVMINELEGGEPVATADLVRRFTLLMLDGLRDRGAAARRL
jgi:hypothetical protein